MARRVLILLGAGVLALAIAAPALAITVHVRVEGLNRTISGKGEPLLRPFTGTLRATDGSLHALSKPTALGALEAASRRAEFFYRLRAFSFGVFVDRIGRFPATGTSGWVYKVNGVSPTVGAADFVLKEGDRVLWYWATFGPSGGPKTLDLARRAGGCYRALAVDDAGKATRARNVVFRLDGRRVRSKSGQICPQRSWRALRVTKDGHVRSQVVRLR